MLLSGISILIIGAFLIFLPELLYKYYNGAINYEALFKDYTWLRYVVAPIMIVVGIVFIMVAYKRKRGMILIHQVSRNIVNEGVNKLVFPFWTKFFSSDTIEMETPLREKKHFETQEEIKETIFKMKFVLEKTNIKSFSYLGADYIPYIVEFGVLLNQCSLKINIYHNFINEKKNSSSRVRKLKKGKHSKDDLENELPTIKKINQSNDVVLCFSSSQIIDIDSLPNKFKSFDVISIKTTTIGRSSIDNERDLNRYSSYIGNQLVELSNKYQQIHLLLSCSSALCLSLGQKIRVHELCPIYVYDFDKGNKSDSRPWCLKLTE